MPPIEIWCEMRKSVGQIGADEPHDRFLVREDADDVGSTLNLLEPLQRIRRMQLGSMLRGEAHVGEHVMFGLVHRPAEFLEPGPQLIGDVPPNLARRLAVGLVKAWRMAAATTVSCVFGT